ncbi:MAG: VWA domain-containing protein, partial [Anaerolineae bacterium]|nr:VWA domain-containing protein [Anaerolineae bacterium]
MCGLILVLASSTGVQAQEAAPTANGIDVVIVLDDSGSMATCWPWSGAPRHADCRPAENPPSDPHDLRYSAARLLMQLAGDEDRVAIVRFNAETQDLIGRLQPLGNRNNRQSLLTAVQPPDDYERAGGYTRIDLGLGRAVQILKSASGPARPRYVILLTDGVPTQEGPQSQDQAIRQAVAELERLGAQVFPVFLCNEKAGCPDDSFVRRSMDKVPDKARTADELLEVFSAVFARMKPDLHVVDRRNAAGDIEFTIREAHGARQLIIVAESGGLIALKRNGNPETVSRAYQDPNILINVVEAGKLAAGIWTITTRSRSGFVVAQTETVPELVYPPPATPGSAAAPHYAPAGKPVLITARVVGPGSGEPLKLNDTTLLESVAAGDPLRWFVLPGPGDLTLQVGEDAGPLQIRRTFRVA